MKIAVLVPNFVEMDGAARVAEVQAKELIEQGHQVDVFAFAADIPPSNYKVHVMGMPKSLFWQRVYRLIFPLDVLKTFRWLPKLRNYDKIIVHLYPMTWIGCLAKTLYKVKYVFWYHGIVPPHLFPNFYERIYMKLQILLTKLTVKNVDEAVAVSKYGQKELKEYTGLNSEVVYNKVDLARFHSGMDGKKIREKHGLGNGPVILFVGTLRPVKGVHLLIQAFKMIKKKIPQTKLVIVGRSDYPYYFKQLKQISDESVIFAGFVPREELPYYYAACDIYASCSMWEIHNVSAIEAQACGKPVIVWHESFKETVDENGVIVEMGDIKRFAQACIEKLMEFKPFQKAEERSKVSKV
ncbi:MAG: glycosyltransferase family 4 protein [Candidatus Bathyarchaeia archaeon]